MNPMHSLCLSHGGCFFFFSRLRLCCFCFSLITSHPSKTSFSFRCKFSENHRRIVKNRLIILFARQTFAWFTSKDEVTIRLSANAAYDVSIAEDFQPPEDWIPGQTINKDVSAVNTGNVDAFVRMWFGGSMRILNEDATPSVDATTADVSSLTAVNDADKIKLGLNYYDATDKKYYKTLSTTQRKNPDLNGTSNDEGTNEPATFSEVQSIQAGGVLVYAPTSAKYHWTLEQATELPVYTAASGTTPDDTVMENLPKGTIVGNSTSDATGVTKKLAPFSASDSNYYGAIDASTFTPETTGLYLFRRTVDETADGTANKYEYSGYYYDATLQKYFALHTDTGANTHSDYVLPAGVINDITSNQVQWENSFRLEACVL